MGNGTLQQTDSPGIGELEEDIRQVVAGFAAPAFHFQPIADLFDGGVAGYEALLRLPTRAQVPPDVCLRIAERMGIQLDLELLVFRAALAFRRELPPNTFLSVNVSPEFLLCAGFERVLEEQGDLVRVVVEITEEKSIADYATTRARVAKIKAMGGMLAIDDAGAGYASLKHILELRPAFVKLDRNFISGCHTDRAKSTVIEMVGAAANRIDAWIIAEGLETIAELAELTRLGVPLAQGFFLGRPAPAMGALSAAATQELRTLARRRAMEDKLLLCADPCPVAHTRLEAETMLANERSCSVIVVLDEWTRPVLVLERHPLLGVRTHLDFMRCQAMTEVPETLQRALTRAPEHRFDPVVLIDTEGRFQGVARVDQMMQAVLSEGSPFLKQPAAREFL